MRHDEILDALGCGQTDHSGSRAHGRRRGQDGGSRVGPAAGPQADDPASVLMVQLQKRIYNEIIGRIKEDDESYPTFKNGYYYYSRSEKEGIDVNRPEINVYEMRKHIGMVFQRPNPFAKSIYRNITFAHERAGVRDRKVLDEIVETSLKQAALWDQVS